MGPDSQTKCLSLSGSYAIDRASDLAREMSDALGQARIVELDLTGVEDLDLPALQILYAAAASAAARGGELRLVGTASEGLCGRLVNGGFAQTGPQSAVAFAGRLPGFSKAPR